MKNKWIDIDSDEPPYGEPVLICINGIVQHVTYSLDVCEDDDSIFFEPYNSNETEHGVCCGRGDLIKWMPLPEC